MQLFPRIWDPSNDQQHAEFYADWLGLKSFPTILISLTRHQAMVIILNGFLHTRMVLCIGVILCGILPVNKMMYREWVIKEMVTGLAEFRLLIIDD